MNFFLAPDWVRKLKADHNMHQADITTDAQAEVAALAAAKGAAFWKQLLKELTYAVEDLPLHHLQGKLSKHGNPDGQEWCHIVVARRMVVPINTQTDVFYRHGDRIIWWRPTGREALALPFVVCERGELGVAATDGFTPMNPAKTAQAIMQGIFRVVAPEVVQS
jgi:hypothetical protein